jgi:hypothetical protein
MPAGFALSSAPLRPGQEKGLGDEGLPRQWGSEGVEVAVSHCREEALSVNRHPLQPDRLGAQAVAQSMDGLMQLDRHRDPAAFSVPITS